MSIPNPTHTSTLLTDAHLSSGPPTILSLLADPKGYHNTSSSNEMLRAHILHGTSLILDFAKSSTSIDVKVAITATSIFHRFVWKRSLYEFDVWEVAMGCVFVAAKIEERKIEVREIVLGFHSMYQDRAKITPKTTILLISSAYTRWKTCILSLEPHLLSATGYALYTLSENTPHGIMMCYLEMLGKTELSQNAWNYCMDSSRLDLSCRYNAEIIAIAAVHLADVGFGGCAILINVGGEEKMWYERFIDGDGDGAVDGEGEDSTRMNRRNKQAVSDVCNALLSIYSGDDSEALTGMISSLKVGGSDVYLDEFGRF